MNKWWSQQEWPCICNRGDQTLHTHYDDWVNDNGLHHCARCGSSCVGYRPDIPEHVAIRMLLGPVMSDEEAATILLGQPPPKEPAAPLELVTRLMDYRLQVLCGFRQISRLKQADLIQAAIDALRQSVAVCANCLRQATFADRVCAVCHSGARCRVFAAVPEPKVANGDDLSVAFKQGWDAATIQRQELLDELEAELKRIAAINTKEDRERVVPELTVFMWLQKARV